MGAIYFRAFHNGQPITKRRSNWHHIINKLVSKQLAVQGPDGKWQLADGVTIEKVDHYGNRLKE